MSGKTVARDLLSRYSDLESENAKLERLLAEANLDIHALKSVFGVKH